MEEPSPAGEAGGAAGVCGDSGAPGGAQRVPAARCRSGPGSRGVAAAHRRSKPCRLSSTRAAQDPQTSVTFMAKRAAGEDFTVPQKETR